MCYNCFRLDIKKERYKLGCLYEFLFELVLEVFFEGYIKLMQLFTEKLNVSPDRRKKINSAVRIYAAILLVSLFCGLILLLINSPTLKLIGNLLALIPIILSVIQIVVGLLLKLIK